MITILFSYGGKQPLLIVLVEVFTSYYSSIIILYSFFYSPRHSLPLGLFSYLTYLVYADPTRLIFIPKAETCVSTLHSFDFITD